MKIHTIYNPDARHSLRHWKNFHHACGIAAVGGHEWADSAEAADAILVFDPERDPYARWLRNHPVVHAYPHKCFSYSELDSPFPYLPGIHVSASRKTWFPERVQTYAYISYGPSEPLRNPFIRFEPDTPKKYLFSFMGRATHRCRRRILTHDFNREDILIECPDYHHWAGNRGERHKAQQQRYGQVARESWFAICPRGDGLGSIRLFEMMEMGICPVIISDDWRLPEGPDWGSFAEFVKEEEVERLVEILDPRREQALHKGRLAREAWLEWFAPERQFDRIGDILQSIKERRRFDERLIRQFYRLALVRPLGRQLKVQLAVLLHKTGIKRIG
jgi:hypothetical protein